MAQRKQVDKSPEFEQRWFKERRYTFMSSRVMTYASQLLLNVTSGMSPAHTFVQMYG